MKLVRGEGSPETGACWMSAISWYAGEKNWNDTPECVCPLLRDLCVNLNDRLQTDEEREQVIGPIMFSVVGTNNAEDTAARRRAMQDEIVEQALPMWRKEKTWGGRSGLHTLRASFTPEECAAAVKGLEVAECDVRDARRIHSHRGLELTIEIHAVYTTEEYVDLILRLAKIGTKAKVTQVRDMAELPQ